AGKVGTPHIQERQQRQADRVPTGVPHDPRQRDPDMAVEKLLPGRPWRWIVMDARALDVLAVTLGRRVVDGEEQAFAGTDDLHRQPQKRAGEDFDIASEAAEEVIIALVIVAEFGSAQPTSHGASATCKEHAP